MNIHQETALPQMGKHWINGEWVHSATVVKAVNPSTGEVLGQYSAGGRIEAAAAISAARRAFDAGAWSHDPQLRSRALLELADRRSFFSGSRPLPPPRRQIPPTG